MPSFREWTSQPVCVLGSWMVAALLALAVAPQPGAAQEGCIFGDRGRNDFVGRTLPGVGRVTYIGGPHFVCEGGVEIFADSSVAYDARGMSDLIGSVRYVEEGREMRADRARYFTNEGRLQAEGNLLVIDEVNGSSIRDGELVYLLETDFRDIAEMTVTVGQDGMRPRAVLTPPPDTIRADSVGAVSDEASPSPDPTEAGGEGDAAAEREPYTVDADRIYLRGQGYFTASGDVVIERDSLFAYADSAEYDQGGDGLVLEGDARVDGEAYELTGRRILMSNPGGDSSQVQALREARLVGEDVLLTAARIVVMLEDGGLERLVATPIRLDPEAEPDSLALQRPEALVEEYVLTADSLSVSAPEERLQRVFAAGRARSVSSARDSLNTEVLPEVARKDWLEGDTVIIRFQGAPPVPPLVDAGPATDVVTGEVMGPDGSSDSLAVADSLVQVRADTPADSAALPDSTVQAADPAAEPTQDEAPPPAPEPDIVLNPVDPDAEPEVEEIVARGSARSLYRLVPNDSTFQAGTHPPAVHYVVGQEIRVRLQEGEVQGMSVTGQTRGVHLEPLRRPAVADSAGALPDSAAVIDTTGTPSGAVVDTMGGTGGGSVDAARPDGTTTKDSETVAPSIGTTPATRTSPRSPRGFVRDEKEHPWNHR